MCPPPEPCDNYEPDYEAAEAQGHLCFGMGYTPPCARCGADELQHQYPLGRFGRHVSVFGF